ncbi:MAG: hypothetical protein DRJ32_01925 [Thermoprotei archaeon]|nr:MAG: hypothetical protein DRJ32_01925 [Thermoprotei archaeon]HDD63559.1 hypothetical protein [Thermoprotei archaeon]
MSILFFKKLAIRIKRLCMNPSEAFKSIEKDPDFLGPFSIILITIAFAILNQFILAQNIFFMIEEFNIKQVMHGFLLSNIQLLLAVQLIIVILMWLIIFAINYSVSRMLGGEAESYALFSASGYLYITQLLHFLSDTVALLIAIRSMPVLAIFMINSKVDDIAKSVGFGIWLSNYGMNLSFIREFTGWLFTLWGGLLNVYLMREVCYLDSKRAIVGGIIAYILITIAAIFVNQMFYG